MREEVESQGGQLRAIPLAAVLGRGPAGLGAQGDEEIEARHLRRFRDPRAQLRLDPLGKAARIAVLMAEGARSLGHDQAGAPRSSASIRARPTSKGSGRIPKSAWKAVGSVTLSSWSMVS